MTILVAGSANLDFVVLVHHVPAPGETVLGRSLQTYPGGKGANQAIACARAGGADTRMLLALGHKRIVSVDISADKRQAALDMGATDVVDGSAPELVQAIHAVTGGPVKAAMDFVNISSTSATGLEILAKDGRLVLVGVGGGELVLSLAGMIFRPRSVMGSLTGNPQDLRDVTALAKAGKLKSLPITRMPKDQANDALMALNEGRAVGRIVLV